MTTAGLVEQFIQSREGDHLSHRALAARVQARGFSDAAVETGTQSPNSLVREILASLEIQPRLLATLALDADRVVRLAVAGNQLSPTHVLLGLVNDLDETVRSPARTELRWREWIKQT